MLAASRDPPFLHVGTAAVPAFPVRHSVGHALLLESGLPFSLDGGIQVHVKRKDIGGEDEGNHPLEYRAGVVVLCEGARDEGDGEEDLDDDEDQFGVEGRPKDSVRSIVYLWGVSVIDDVDGDIYVYIRTSYTYVVPTFDTPNK